MRAPARQSTVAVQAMVREWPDKEFIQETLSNFPEEGVANVEQARVGTDYSQLTLHCGAMGVLKQGCCSRELQPV